MEKINRVCDLLIKVLVAHLDLKAAELRWFSDKSQYARGYWEGYNDAPR